MALELRKVLFPVYFDDVPDVLGHELPDDIAELAMYQRKRIHWGSDTLDQDLEHSPTTFARRPGRVISFGRLGRLTGDPARCAARRGGILVTTSPRAVLEPGPVGRRPRCSRPVSLSTPTTSSRAATSPSPVRTTRWCQETSAPTVRSGPTQPNVLIHISR